MLYEDIRHRRAKKLTAQGDAEMLNQSPAFLSRIMHSHIYIESRNRDGSTFNISMED